MTKHLTAFLALLMALAFAAPAQAALTFQLRTGDSATNSQAMTFDSNQCPNQGPNGAMVGGVITNTGSSAVTNISATFSGLSGNYYALLYPATATQTIGSLGANESATVFWFVKYVKTTTPTSCTGGLTASPTITISSSLAPQTVNLSLITKSAISADAGGNLASGTLGPGAVVGQTIYYTANYTFKQHSVGDEVYLQPAGNTSFNAACFQLISTEISSSTVSGVTSGATNKLYFKATGQASSGAVTVIYGMKYLCASASTTARPYSQLTSGTQLKYTGNYDGAGSISISYPGATNPFTITKSVVGTAYLSGTPRTVTYTVTISNPSAFATILGSITDTLPAGATFSAIDSTSGVTAANSSSVPATGATGTVTFTGKFNQSYALAAGGSVILKYSVVIPASAGSYVNSAYGTFGTAANTPTATATVTVSDPQALVFSKTSVAYRDPFNGTTNPKLIPGGTLTYLLSVQNPNVVALDTDSVIITDPTAANLSLVVADFGASGSGPLDFAQGTTPSTLTYSFISLASQSDDIDFSKDGGASWDYLPQPDANGTDAMINRIRIRPKGNMAAGSSIDLQVRYRIN